MDALEKEYFDEMKELIETMDEKINMIMTEMNISDEYDDNETEDSLITPAWDFSRT